MNDIYIMDYEVFAHDWLVVFKNIKTKEYRIFHNEPDAVMTFQQTENPFLGTFNGKHYDRYIHQGVLAGFSPEEIKLINDWIIVHGEDGWKCPLFRYNKCNFEFFDLMDDTQAGTSLKSFEAHYGMDIEETEVDFNIDRPLTKEELEMTIHYCKHDVDATETLFELRKDYLKSKVQVGSMVGIPPHEAMYLTNAGLTARFLGAVKTTYKDERQYVYPENLKLEYIPQEVIDFFNRMYDSTLSYDDVFKSKIKINIGETEVTIGYGGVHAGIPNYQFRSDQSER